jgi:hypothetical protein
MDFIETAIKEGKIPDIPQTTLINGIPTYPSGIDPTSLKVCSATYECRIKGDHWDAPDGEITIGFDDGPTDVSGIILFSARFCVSPAVVLSNRDHAPSD